MKKTHWKINKTQFDEILFKTFGTFVMIACGGELKDFVAEFRKWCKTDEFGGGRDNSDGKTLVQDTTGNIGMWTKKKDPSHVVHEAVHVSHHLFRLKGIVGDDELVAYHV